MRWKETSNGYIAAYHGGKKVYQHRFVWEQHNGPIPEGYYVHHVDGNPKNNDISNLVLLAPRPHRARHSQEAQRLTITVLR